MFIGCDFSGTHRQALGMGLGSAALSRHFCDIVVVGPVSEFRAPALLNMMILFSYNFDINIAVDEQTPHYT